MLKGIITIRQETRDKRQEIRGKPTILWEKATIRMNIKI